MISSTRVKILGGGKASFSPGKEIREMREKRWWRVVVATRQGGTETTFIWHESGARALTMGINLICFPTGDHAGAWCYFSDESEVPTGLPETLSDDAQAVLETDFYEGDVFPPRGPQ